LIDIADLKALRERHALAKAALLAPLLEPSFKPRNVNRLLELLSAHTDRTLSELWKMADMPPDHALVAVGGYGRGKLFPGSDIDVLVLHPLQPSPEAMARVETFITACWDLGLEIGSSVRSIDDCIAEASADVTVQTALLESRRICGHGLLVHTMHKSLARVMDPRGFMRRKILEMEQRHQKFQNSPYALEPNCKDSPGGLRDLQVLMWVAQGAGLGNSWKALAQNGIITPFELKQIRANEALLSLIRARLHMVAKRREDRLIFDLQSAVADVFGLKAEGEDTRHARRASELLMRRYYWAAKAVTQLRQIVLLNIKDHMERQRGVTLAPLRPINERFYDKDGLIEVAHDDLYLRYPQAILETFHLYQTEVSITGLSARTLRALYAARPIMNGAFRSDPANRAMFMRILRAPEGITHAMRLMNQTSVLGRYLWVFRGIVGQMQHDLFHVYTVDMHILMVLRNIRRFFIADHSHEYPFCSQLASGWSKPWVLYVAALFHDIAKGRGGDHSELGAKDVRSFCKTHGIADEDRDLIEFLVSEHLTMSQVAQKQDISDPDVIHAFTQKVRNERYLTGLYLLTVADIRGTSPKVWNAWKGRLLEDLYKQSLRALGGSAPDPDAQVAATRRDAQAILALNGLAKNAQEHLWSTLGVDYFMRHDADEIAWHTRLISGRPWDGVSPEPPVVRARQAHEGRGIQVMVFSHDQTDLFARICGYFDRQSYTIMDAKIHTTRDGHVLDSFELLNEQQGVEVREAMGLIEAGLSHELAHLAPLRAPVVGRVSRRVRSFPMRPHVALSPDEKGQHWLLTVSASDRNGLLYSITHTLASHKISVELAKIMTLGERVEDVFLISGEALASSERRIELETALLQALED
jgi:[protein-PII] uridylyltransferase